MSFQLLKLENPGFLTLKYLIPILLIGVWAFVNQLIYLIMRTHLKIIVDAIISVVVIGLSILFTKLNPR